GDGGCLCSANDQASRQTCEIGVCDPYFCADNSFCAYGQQCGLLPDSGISYTQCYSDYDPTYRPYCATCSIGGGLQTCGTGPNYSRIDTAHPGSFFCGSDCSTGQICPRGYSCQDVIVVGLPGTQQCARSNPVCNPNSSLPCHIDSDCRRGGLCSVPFGQDAG